VSERILTHVSLRTLSTADVRREAVLQAAERVVAERGLHAAPTTEVARAAGISQAYLFKLFPTKDELLVATVRRSHERIHSAFAEAAARAKAAGDDPLQAMGAAYAELVADRDQLLVQIHAHAAAPSMPHVREAARECFGALVELVERETGAGPDQVRAFFAAGMLMNVMAALDAGSVREHWAEVLSAHLAPERSR
jgi:AcrR family transcriptional regulator